MTPSCSLEDYYKGFRSTSGVMTGILTAVPIVGEITKGTVSATLFPPVGWAFALPTLLVIVVLTTAIYGTHTATWIQSAGRRRRVLWFAFGAALPGLAIYIASYSRFVRELPVKDEEPHYVAVGFERRNFTDPHLRDGSDWDLLRYRGLSDEDVQFLWTQRSIIIARIVLVMSYLLVLLPPVAAFSFVVLFGVLGAATSP
jgi:hypothetical protein